MNLTLWAKNTQGFQNAKCTQDWKEWKLIALVPLPCMGLTLNSPLSTTAWPRCLFCWEPGPPAASWVPAIVCFQWRGLMWGCSSCLLPPPLTALISALQFTPDQQRLHFTQEFSIFYFLSPSRARPHHHHHTHNGPQTNGKTSGALQLQHAWYVRPATMTLAVEGMESHCSSIVSESHQR